MSDTEITGDNVGAEVSVSVVPSLPPDHFTSTSQHESPQDILPPLLNMNLNQQIVKIYHLVVAVH